MHSTPNREGGREGVRVPTMSMKFCIVIRSLQSFQKYPNTWTADCKSREESYEICALARWRLGEKATDSC